MHAVVVGVGAVGQRVAQGLAGYSAFESVTVVHRDPNRFSRLVRDAGARIRVERGTLSRIPKADVTVIAVPAGARRAAQAALENGSDVVCCTADPSEVRALLALDSEAQAAGLTVAVGTAMAPGLSCVLAVFLRDRFERVDSVHVASLGTGGPACARRHHSALAGVAVDWEDGDWRRRPGGSGRELVWFPEPVGGADCYRASLADPVLLTPAFPGVRRVTSRIEATRRDRMTSWLPMLRRPHAEGRVGAVRVEVRGWVSGRAETRIIGAAVAPAPAAAAVSAEAAWWAVSGRLARTGAAGLAELVGEPGQFLKAVAEAGVEFSTFEGHDVLERDEGGAA
jgi:saccharopine dehydrogenase-like NADP-dependent oxidoreductase